MVNSEKLHFQLTDVLTNTVGTIRRCGRFRIEVVLLLATLANKGSPEIMDLVREFHVTEIVVVWCDDDACCIGVTEGVSLEQYSSQRLRSVCDGAADEEAA